MKAVILAGGLGTRLREETEFRPKPMVEIGGRPIIWHIMKNLSEQGISHFIVCLGYKGDVIRDFFLNYSNRSSDVTVQLNSQRVEKVEALPSIERWRVTLAETGSKTSTGGRLHRVKKYLDNETFLCTYGDGLADINLASLQEFHASHPGIGTVTAVVPPSRFGALDLRSDGRVVSFREKPDLSQRVNGGFFVFDSGVFDFLDVDSTLEHKPLEEMAETNNLFAYKHDGFWKPMDTIREAEELNEIWNQGSAPWKNWM